MSVRGIPLGNTSAQRGVWQRIDLLQDGVSHYELLTCPDCARQNALNVPEKKDKTNIGEDGKLRFNCPWCSYDEEVQLADYADAVVYRPQKDPNHPAGARLEKAAKAPKAGKKVPSKKK